MDLDVGPLTGSSLPLPAQQGPPAPSANTKLDSFALAISKASRKATFTCGGRILINIAPNIDDAGNLTPRTANKKNDGRILTKPVTIRWGRHAEGEVLRLPAMTSDHEGSLRKLIAACEPATFGMGGKDFLDESYRKAGSLSPNDFATDFCPYECGIIDVVTQLLLPSVSGGDLRPIECKPFRPDIYLPDARVNALKAEVKKFAESKEDIIHAMKFGQFLHHLGVPVQGNGPFSRQLAHMLDLDRRYREGLLTMPGDEKLGYFSTQEAVEIAAQRLVHKGNAKKEKQHYEKEKKILVAREKKLMSRGLRAELYKLNVYSGPSGLFRKHVDTPRGETQVGSLVVCLPVPFEGGALTVRHQGQEVLHDWSSPEPAIHWAAFYSDVEHEVLPVTSGNRLTLTYNLYHSSGTGMLNTRPSSLLPAQTPLYEQLISLLNPSSNFLPNGGRLGIHLTHSYPHTHPRLHAFVPQMLKGVDMALYTSLVASNFTPVIVPIDSNGLPPSRLFIPFHNLKRAASGPHYSLLQPFGASDDEYSDDSDGAYEEAAGFDSEDGEYDPEEELSDRKLEMRERIKMNEKIVWVGGDREWKEASKVYMAYGNQAELKVSHSSVALVVGIPSIVERIGAGSSGDPIVVDE